MTTDLHRILTFELIRLGSTPVTLGGLLTALVIIVLAFVLARVLRVAFDRMRSKAGPSASSLYIVQKLASYGVVVLGLFLAMNAAGLNLSSFAVFAGALGVGVGLGLQGIVKEFVSGLVLIFDRVLNIGDYVEMSDGKKGTVQEIGPRATRIRTNDNVDILIPNSKLVENAVVNWTLKGDGRRIHIPFGVAYGSDKQKVREVVLKAAHDVPFTLPDDGPRKAQVWMTSFGESSLNFELLVWPTLDAVKRPAAMQAAYTWAIEDALRGAGIEMPFPQMDIHLRTLFGLESARARAALRLEAEADGAGQGASRPTAPVSSSNDAAHDLMSGGGADVEPPVSSAPAPVPFDPAGRSGL